MTRPVSGAQQKLSPAESEIDTAVVIVNYNSFADICRCVESLETLDTPVHIIIIDNNSPDGSGELLRQRFSRFPYRVVSNPENSGFAGGTNIGIALSRSLGVSYIWLLNPDTEVCRETLSAMRQELELHPHVAAVGSKIRYGTTDSETTADTPALLWSCGGVVDARSGQMYMRGNQEPDAGQYDIPCDCSYLPGCSVLARADVFHDVGYLDERYFMYFEETDWCMRVRQAGYALRYVPQSVVIHHTSDEKLQKALVVYYYNRNERLFWLRFGSLPLRVKTWLRVLIKDLPQAAAAVRACPDDDMREVFKAHLRGYRDALLFRSGAFRR